MTREQIILNREKTMADQNEEEVNEKHKLRMFSKREAPEATKSWSMVALGWTSATGFVLLLLVIIVVCYSTVATLMKPQPFLEKYISDSEKRSNLDASMAVALEYQSMAIRAQGIQVASGLLAGLALIAAGLLLFA